MLTKLSHIGGGTGKEQNRSVVKEHEVCVAVTGLARGEMFAFELVIARNSGYCNFPRIGQKP